MITIRPLFEWYTPEIAAAKKKRSKSEQLWRRTGLIVHREAYKEERNHVNSLLAKAKKSFYNTKIKECKDQKSLFKFVNTLLHRNEVPHLPSHGSITDLLELFNDYFRSKIAKIRRDLDACESRIDLFPSVCAVCPTTKLSVLESISESQAAKLICDSPSKSCFLDPIPTWLLKEHADILVTPITSIINQSLSTGAVPLNMKSAIVNPLLKKLTLDQDCLKNYRPVSNLTFVSKLVEKAVDMHVSDHMNTHGLFAKMQSAYRPNHSVESALIRVHNDILLEFDKSKGVILVLLDNSAAFDTLDHDLLLQCLETQVGITGKALKWFGSYLQGRSQRIFLNSELSDPTPLFCGVPQGSVFGPKAFITITRDVERIAEMYGVSVHLYADDTQLYVSFDLNSPDDLAAKKFKLERCIAHISAWMLVNKLKLNQDKTEVIILCHPRQRHKLPDLTIQVGDSAVAPTPCTRNLGVLFDQSMSMVDQITAVCKATNFHLRNIGKIRKFLTKKSAETIIHALVTSRLDNNNGLLVGVPECQIKRLERLQKTAARIVLCTSRFQSVDILTTLHWLPIKERMSFKILLLVFKALNGLAPSYLSDILTPYEPVRSLRSQEKYLLQIPKSKLASGGDRAFSVIGPKLWNCLPVEIKSCDTVANFKIKLKTFLFNEGLRRY